MDSPLRLNQSQVKNLKDINELSGFDKPGWIFRGQREAFWNLEPALERAQRQAEGHKMSAMQNRESVLLREFQRRHHLYANRSPLHSDYLEWLSIMQHHGAPTRLLDWTYSIYAAIYFAIEDAEKPCAVWGMRTKWAYDVCSEVVTDPTEKAFLQLPLENTKEHRDLFSSIFMSKNRSDNKRQFVCPLAPFRLNERMTTQKGLFVIPVSLKETFEANLSMMSGVNDEKNFFKLIISESLRNDLMRCLYSMNITRTTLFPGLDGFAQSLKHYHPALDPTVGRET